MSEGVLAILKFSFLALLYVFLAMTIRVVLLEMRGARKQSNALQGKTPSVEIPSPPSPPQTKEKDPTWIRIVEPPGLAADEFSLQVPELTIGRGTECGVVINGDTSVSGSHCRIIRQGERLFIEDLGSTNGTFLNDDEVVGSIRLLAGDHLRVGDTILVLEA